MICEAIIFDLDGTAIPSRLDGLPSKQLIQTISSIKHRIRFATASGRSVDLCRPIWRLLNIETPCIVSGGSRIVDPRSEQVIWQQLIPQKAVVDITSLSRRFGLQLSLNGELTNQESGQEVYNAILTELDTPLRDIIYRRLLAIPDLTVLSLPSWNERLHDIHITHSSATKKHAVDQLLKILGINKKNVVGVGDGENDLSLFESVGYKVAMGNAPKQLIEAADYVTDNVENDGLAKVIAKIIST